MSRVQDHNRIECGGSGMNSIKNEIAGELGINAYIVESVIRSEFKFIRKVMEEGSFRPIWLKYFGIFAISLRRWGRYLRMTKF